jgi:hypothetical protein
VITAADVDRGDVAASIAVLVVATLFAFYIAHVYAVLLGRWAEERIVPDMAETREELRRQWPMISVVAIPVLVLLLGSFDVVDDRTAINVALAICLFELIFTAWYASREAGANRSQSVIAVAIAVGIGIIITALKAALH